MLILQSTMMYLPINRVVMKSFSKSIFKG